MKGKFIVVVGPSGVGKNTLINLFLEEFDNSILAVSATTRPIREGEIPGQYYVYLSFEEFEQKIKDGDLLEYELIHGKNYYGLLKSKIDEFLSADKLVIKDINVKGMMFVKKNFKREDYVSIFIRPAKNTDLRERILSRSDLSDEEIKSRLKSYEMEMEYVDESDLVIESIEGDIPKTYENFKKSILEFIK